jgi:hypothetical protein
MSVHTSALRSTARSVTAAVMGLVLTLAAFVVTVLAFVLVPLLLLVVALLALAVARPRGGQTPPTSSPAASRHGFGAGVR